jgi:hypothetical protein
MTTPTFYVSAHILLLTKMKIQNTLEIVAALSILIAARVIASSTIAFENVHAVTARSTSTSGTAYATASASISSGSSASSTTGPCLAFASILGAIAHC